MARWIHEFRSSGERALTEGERIALNRRVFVHQTRRYAFGALAAVAFMGALVWMMFVSNGLLYLWPLVFPFVGLGFYAISWANAAEKLALLHRRALRLGTVEEFRRVRGDETSKNFWSRISGEKDENGEVTVVPDGTYWTVDERFERELARSARGRADAFEAVGRDGAILWVEGQPVRKLLEPPVWDVAG